MEIEGDHLRVLAVLRGGLRGGAGAAERALLLPRLYWRALHRTFFELARSHGRRRVRCVTSPENTTSQAFHTRPGFTASGVKRDHDGP
ncbi:hypothetical protein [Streptomyces virginiae]|uniref:hypothetical protein n=1 Tax=Streptomyces virginiae TaxID=1961 RepID=UPI0036FF0575